MGNVTKNEYDQELPQSQNSDQPTHREEQLHDIYSTKTF